MLWIKWLFAIPFGFLFAALHFLMRLMIRDEPFKADIPPNAILFFTHRQIYPLALTPEIKRGGVLESHVLGYEGFIPYIWATQDRIVGIQYLLFKRGPQALAQVLNLLKTNPDKRLAIATDSGGPYGKVRRSLLKLSIESGRPVVAIGGKFTCGFTIYGHHLPLLGATLELTSFAPIPAERLQQLAELEAMDLLQSELDRLTAFGKSASK